MLTLAYAQAVECENAYRILDIALPVKGSNFLFLDDGKVVGLFRITFCPDAYIDDIRFQDGVSDDDKKFFIHAMFYKLMIGTPMVLKIKGEHQWLNEYGFVYADDEMSVITSKINLHSSCKGQK